MDPVRITATDAATMARFTPGRQLHRTRDNSALVEEGDPRCAFLHVRFWESMPMAEAIAWGLVEIVPDDAPEPTPTPETKAITEAPAHKAITTAPDTKRRKRSR